MLFFDGWTGVVRVLVASLVGYGSLLLFLRLSGNRTLAKLNAFDLVITVSLGSTLATMALSKQVPIVEGTVAIGLLILLQYSIAWLIVRSPTAGRVLRTEPQLVMHKGEFLARAMRQVRLTEADIRSVVRQQGLASLEDVEAVVLETDGTLSVVKSSTQGTPSAISDIELAAPN